MPYPEGHKVPRGAQGHLVEVGSGVHGAMTVPSKHSRQTFQDKIVCPGLNKKGRPLYIFTLSLSWAEIDYESSCQR